MCFILLLILPELYGFDRGEIVLLYDSWNNSCGSSSLEESIPGPIILCPHTDDPQVCYCKQMIGNPDGLANSDGTFYIYGYGDHDLTYEGTKLGDAIYMLKRDLDGSYTTEIRWDDQTGSIVYCDGHGPILNFKEDTYEPFLWTKVGWLGQGMAVVYSAQGDICGHHYFGIVPVFDKGDRDDEELDLEFRCPDDRAFLAWAVSEDGLVWKFLNDVSVMVRDCDDAAGRLTGDPKNAFSLLYRGCFQMTGYGSDDGNETGRAVFHHVSAFYSDPGKYSLNESGQPVYGDGYIYLSFGYTPVLGGGVWNGMARVELDLNNYFGLGEIQLFKNDPDGPFCSGAGQWVTLGDCQNYYNCSDISTECELGIFQEAGGCIPCNLDIGKNRYVYNEAVPLEWAAVYKGNRLLEHLLIYNPAFDFSKGQMVVRASENITPPFAFTEEHALGNCLVSSQGYSPCEAGGVDIGLIQPPCTSYWKSQGYYDLSCNPLALAAYVNVADKLCAGRVITTNSGGLLAAKMDLLSIPWTDPVPCTGNGLKVQKEGADLKLTWPVSTDAQVNAYRVYEGGMGPDRFEKTGVHCPSDPADEIIVYDHVRKVCKAVSSPVFLTPGSEENRYYLVAPLCDRGEEIFQCYEVPNYYPFAYISEGPFCDAADGERLRGVCHCPEASGCGTQTQYFPQPGDSER